MGRDEGFFVLGIVALAAAMLISGHAFLAGLVAAVGAFTFLWFASLLLRDAGIVDVAWGPGFLIVGGTYLALAQTTTSRGLLVMALVTAWALRLAIYIGRRNAGQGEDHRYAKWRSEAGGAFWWRSYFKVFLLQSVVLWVVSSPLLLATLPGKGAPLRPLDAGGLILWSIGFLFEAVSDWQMTRFKADPANAGQVMKSGLWGLSRHPNYFGEAVLWWGVGLLAVPTGGWLALGGPALMMFTLMRVSGVTLLDRAMVERRPGYAEYIRSTPAFFPVRFGRRTTGA